jgi:hypothetical protein
MYSKTIYLFLKAVFVEVCTYSYKLLEIFFVVKLSSKDVHICEKNNKQQLKKRLKSFSCFHNFLPNVFKMMPKKQQRQNKKS